MFQKAVIGVRCFKPCTHLLMQPPEKKLVGRITHYFPKIGVGVIELVDELKVGDTISIEGVTTNFQQVVESMQIEHKNVEAAKAGDAVGLKVKERVREKDQVFKLLPPRP
jgi:putative protease